ncbi:hypothetical protein [Deminuibacter soli]|uniref:Uncharacterized protein n=1 Tax=Deminuibacter soli TaxID=2291815 RepID=A0A3E1NI13_9BACT|nr:hypothetical protein [Deminuibacter soli]RFM27501.1 hypothetical protein DXN05_15945 [Deminuibacter soli]
MAWIPMYLLDKDIDFLNDWLNQEEEIAFLVSNGHKKWIAKKEHTIKNDIGNQNFGDGYNFVIPNYAEYNLWHIPSGQLPLPEANNGSVTLKFHKEDSNEDGKVDNPWLGWTEIRTGANSRIPYFGAGYPGVIHLEINLPHDQEIRMSNFGWIGNHYKLIGNGAEQTTEKFWNKLRRMAKKIGTQIPRSNTLEGKKEVFAFPTAYEEIKNGRPCSLNP